MAELGDAESAVATLNKEHIQVRVLSWLQNNLYIMDEYTLEEITEYLNNLGYEVIKTKDLDKLEEIIRNYPG